MKNVFVIKEITLQPFKDGHVKLVNYVVTQKSLTNVIEGAKRFDTYEEAEGYIRRNFEKKATSQRLYEVFEWIR